MLRILAAGLSLTNIAISGLTAIALICMYSLYGYHYRIPEYAIFWSVWGISPYLTLALFAFVCRKSFATELILAFGSSGLSYWGLTVFCSHLRPWHLLQTPPGSRIPMNCAGPIVEVGLPMLQWGAVTVVGVICIVVLVLECWLRGRLAKEFPDVFD